MHPQAAMAPPQQYLSATSLPTLLGVVVVLAAIGGQAISLSFLYILVGGVVGAILAVTLTPKAKKGDTSTRDVQCMSNR